MKVYSNDMDQDHMHSNCVSTNRVENGKNAVGGRVGIKLIQCLFELKGLYIGAELHLTYIVFVISCLQTNTDKGTHS